MTSEIQYRFQIDQGPNQTKRRRLHGACDICRRKKIRCDSAERPGKPCTHCEGNGSQCTHFFASQKKEQVSRKASTSGTGDVSQPGGLAQLHETMDPLLTTVLSGTYAETTNLTLLRETLVNVSRYARALEAALPPGTLSKGSSQSPPTDFSSPSKTTDSNPSPEPEITIKEEGQEIHSLTDTFKRTMALSGSGDRFFGPSSSFALMDSAASQVATFGGDKDGYGFFQRADAITANGVKQHMRPVFWNVLPWEKAPPPDNRPFDFPEQDLLETLVDLYFDNVNFYMPLLHRPTIDRALKEGLHRSDPGFAGVVLAMCALGSRYSNDRRVLLEGANGSLHSSGFKWFRQIRMFGEFCLRAPSLYELQALCLAVTYVHGSSTQEKAWYLIGLGIRAAQDIGLNHKDCSSKPTVDGELRKRIFWHLLFADSITASAVGRPPAIHLSDFDVDLPIECDDEYWEDPDPEKAFKQPPGKPSKVSYFCSLLRLLQIHCKSHRDFYSVRRPEPPPGYTAEEWNRISLSNLDSALNEWVDSLPDHLRWDPTNTQGALLDQSAALFCTYYTTQMLTHRLFVASRDHPALAFSSLAICTNAARACIRIMETQSKKGRRFAPQIMKALATAALMLILNICGSRRTGFPVIDETKEIGLVHTCIDVLRTFEDRWHSAGRYRDILIALTSTGGLQPKTTTAQTKTSRRRNHRWLEQCECKPSDVPAPTAEQRPKRSLPSAIPANPAPRPSVASSDSPDSQASSRSQPSSQTDGSSGASATDNQPPCATLSAAPTVTARPDTLFDAIPLYSSDLSKPFPLFDEAEHNYDSTWKQQLDELQALWEQTAASGGGQNLGVGDGLPIQDLNIDGLFVDSSGSTSFGPPLSSAPTSIPSASGIGVDLGSMGPSPTGSFSPDGQRLASASAPLQQASTFDFGGSVLDPQGAALWIDVPSTYNMDEWGSYISNVNSLNTVPTQQYQHNETTQSAAVQGINFGFMTGKKQQQASRKKVPVTIFSQTEPIVDLRARMDPLLKKVLSGSNLPESADLLRETLVVVARYARSLEDCISISTAPSQPPSQPATTVSTPPRSPPVLGNDVEVLDAGSDEDDFETALADNLRRSLMLTDPKDRFIGASSSVGIFGVATQELNEIGPIGLAGRRDGGMALKRYLRPEFWSVHPWEQPPPPDTRPFDFPEPDLLKDLIELHFTNCNFLLPLLHRPTVDKWLKEGLHLSDPGIGGVIISMCAVGARFSNDPRVLLEGTTSLHSCGYKWFRQIRIFKESWLRAPSLYDLQALCFAILYLLGSSTPEKCWYLVGWGIRAAQDIGLNRRSSATKHTFERELRNRIFWGLFLADSVTAAAIGRPPAIDLNDVDVDMPSECDDEYWENPDPELAFKQPPGILSKVSFFCHILGLIQIHSSSSKAFYAARRPDLPPGVSAEERDRATLANLDSQLNAWLDGLPEHLRWGSDSQHTFIDQSAVLSTLYNHVQILLHRPFVASRNHPSLALASLAICTNAARSCIRTAATHSRKGYIPAPQVHMALFSSGLMLILNIWRARRMGSAIVDEVREMKNVYTCIAVLKTFELRWHSAGRFSDLLTAMASIGGFPESPFSRPVKRGHDSLTDGSDQRSAEDRAKCSPDSNSSPGMRASNSLGGGIPVNGGSTGETPQVFVKSADSPFASVSSPFFSGGDLSQTFSDLNQVEGSYNQASMGQLQNAQSQSTNNISDMATDLSKIDSSIASHWPADTAMSEVNGNNLLDLPGAALWTGVPITYDLDDWGQYISNVEALNNNPPNNGRQFTEMFQGVEGFDLSGLSGSSSFQAYPAQFNW